MSYPPPFRSAGAVVVLAAGAALASLPGCFVAAAGAAVGYVQYDRNEIGQDYDADLETTWKATLEALSALGHPDPRSRDFGAMDGTIRDEDLVVRVERHPEGFTRVLVRWGTFRTEDNQRKAKLILAEIEKRLPMED